ncbi:MULTISPECIES: hypothetical protein [Halomonas]|uniref:hypothetical protein n=1 Tax=Halomonas TaxID=2745 RepID=UPI0018691A7E|nr:MULTISPECIES: hypothetical protein [Halomonas]
MFGRKKKPQPPENNLAALKDLPQDADALRELQRFVQIENLDAWMQRMYHDQRRARRFTLAFRFGLLAVVAAGIGNTTYLIKLRVKPRPFRPGKDSARRVAPLG